MSTEDDRDVAEADRAAAEVHRVEAEETRVEAEGERVEAEAGDGGELLELSRVEAEEGRVHAEELREERENRRRIAEGGPDQHVEGNAKTGRVEAEQAREHHANQVMKRVATLIALPIALVALVPSVLGLVLLQREIDHRCEDAALNRVAIRAAVTDGLASLGYVYRDGKIFVEGQPLDYYTDHPDERAQVLERTKKSLARFETINCN